MKINFRYDPKFETYSANPMLISNGFDFLDELGSVTSPALRFKFDIQRTKILRFGESFVLRGAEFVFVVSSSSDLIRN